MIDDGTSHVSRIHVVDLVAAILAPASSPVTGAINVADDDPAPLGEVADAARRTPLPALRPSAGPGNRLLFPAAFALLVLIAASGSFLSLAYRIRRGDRS